MVEPQPRTVVIDAGGLTEPDASTVDALARLALTARRCGCRVTVEHANGQLQELLALAGLADVVPLCSGSALQVRGQPEDGEQLGVEKDGDPADPVA